MKKKPGEVVIYWTVSLEEQWQFRGFTNSLA